MNPKGNPLKSSLECIPCFLGQALNAAQRFGADDVVRARIMMEVLKEVERFDRTRSSPEMGAMIHRIAADAVGVEDLYFDVKRACNEAVLSVLPSLREKIARADDPFETAVRACIAANLIDFTAPGGDTDTPLPALFAAAMSRPLAVVCGENPIARLKERAFAAESILYLLDNAGEVVADRLLIEQLPRGRVTAVVRGGPIANDVLMEDARAASIHEVAEVIDSGLALPGTLLNRCSKELRERFHAADLVISKGQGNFETLDFLPNKLFFLFVVKCEVVANYLGAVMGDTIVCDSAGCAISINP